MPRLGRKSVGPEGAELVSFRVNGEPVEVAFAPHKTLLEVLREDLGLTGHQARLRARRVRHLRRARRRQAGALLPRARARVRGPARRDGRGHGRAARAPSAAEGLRRPRRRAVRLLHARISADGEGAPRREPEADARRRSARRSPETSAAAPATSRSSRPSSSPPPGCGARTRSRGKESLYGSDFDESGLLPVATDAESRSLVPEVRAPVAKRPPRLVGATRPRLEPHPRRRPSLRQGRRRREGHRADEVRRRPDAAAHAPLQAPALEDRARAHRVDRRVAGARGAGRDRGRDRARTCRSPSASSRSRRTSTRSAPTASGSSATRSPPSRRWTRTRRSTRSIAIDVDYEPLPPIGSIDDGLAPAETPIHDYGDAGNIHKLVSMEFGDTEEGFARGRPRLRGPLLLRGQHAPAARAARRGRGLRPRRQADALVLDADAALRPPRAREGARHAAREDPRHRDPQRRRLRRQVRSLQPRDRRRAPVARHRPAREDLPDPRGGLLLPPRPPPDAHAGEDRREEGRRDHGDALPDGARRRRLRLLRRRVDVLHGRAADRDLPGAGVPLRRRARLHQQAAVRPQARPRHAAAALRARGRSSTRSPATSASTRPRCAGSTSHPPDSLTANFLRVGSIGLGACIDKVVAASGWKKRRGKLPRGPGPRARLLVLHLRRGAADLLERDAAVRRPAEARPRRRRHRVLRLDRDRPGLRLDPRVDRRRGARASIPSTSASSPATPT